MLRYQNNGELTVIEESEFTVVRRTIDRDGNVISERKMVKKPVFVEGLENAGIPS